MDDAKYKAVTTLKKGLFPYVVQFVGIIFIILLLILTYYLHIEAIAKNPDYRFYGPILGYPIFIWWLYMFFADFTLYAIVLDEHGFTMKRPFSDHHFTWDEITEIAIKRAYKGRLYANVKVNGANNARRRWKILSHEGYEIQTPMTMGAGRFGSGPSLDPAEMVVLLNEAKQQHDARTRA